MTASLPAIASRSRRGKLPECGCFCVVVATLEADGRLCEGEPGPRTAQRNFLGRVNINLGTRDTDFAGQSTGTGQRPLSLSSRAAVEAVHPHSACHRVLLSYLEGFGRPVVKPKQLLGSTLPMKALMILGIDPFPALQLTNPDDRSVFPGRIG